MTFLYFDGEYIKYIGKEETNIDQFATVQKFFYNSAIVGHTSLTISLKNYFFQGFEWKEKINTKKVETLEKVVYPDFISNNIEQASFDDKSCKKKIKLKIKNLLRNLKENFLTYIIRDKFRLAHKKWVKADGDNTLRIDYDLNSNSVVFDLGGYKGEFAQKLVDKYNCNLYIFEPVPFFYDEIINRFSHNNKVKVYNFGLSDKNEEMEISLSNDGSSVYIDSATKEKIYLKDITDFLVQENIEKIDLMKINIEGGEFDIIPALIKNHLIDKIDNLQIQFHTFIDSAIKRRAIIREKLSRTHQLTYDYWFVWENWKIKK